MEFSYFDPFYYLASPSSCLFLLVLSFVVFVSWRREKNIEKKTRKVTVGGVEKCLLGSKHGYNLHSWDLRFCIRVHYHCIKWFRIRIIEVYQRVRLMVIGAGFLHGGNEFFPYPPALIFMLAGGSHTPIHTFKCLKRMADHYPIYLCLCLPCMYVLSLSSPVTVSNIWLSYEFCWCPNFCWI